jgi:hypothetical protein
MGKVRRHGYIFTWNVGDHSPVHIHVYKNGKLICRWRLFDELELTGKASSKLRETIKELRSEGAFEVLERLKDEDQ